ncbi:MAG: DUF721 domain-containing protein [Deltaproteobacteria bacterium]|nr:DUF721 domain-containing protein [Deltaproteobacteria bacterium]
MRRKRKGRPTPLTADITSVLRKIGKGQPGVHPEIWARWGEIIGEDLAGRIVPRSLYGKTLTVAVASSTWMNQLTYLKPRLLDQFAEEIGPNVVKEIRLVLDHSIAKHRVKAPVTIQKPPTRSPLPTKIVSATSGIDDDELREILERAAQASLEHNS